MDDYVFKTEPFQHQCERFYQYRDKTAHAHFWEQRTGKSKITLDTAAYQYGIGRIMGLLVIAPCGVHINWVATEIPKHLPDHVYARSAVWYSDPRVPQRKTLEALFEKGDGLRVLSMNIEAVNTAKGFDMAVKFMTCFKTLLVIDEGSIIKNAVAARTRKVLKLSRYAETRRVLNGTPVTQGPLDVYPQFTFLDEEIFGNSFVAFRNRYAVIEMQGKMHREISKKLESVAGLFQTYAWGDIITSSHDSGFVVAGQQPLDNGLVIDFRVKQQGRSLYKLAWQCGGRKDVETMRFRANEVYPVITGYKHLDELQGIIAPHCDRVLKTDCYDLPPKIYQKMYIDLTPAQRKMYKDLKRKCIAEVSGRTMTATMALTKMLRLQQITGGFFTPDPNVTAEPAVDELEFDIVEVLSKGAIPIEKKNQRILKMVDNIESSMSGKILIWARFTAEIQAIATELRKRFGRDEVVELYGEISSSLRQEGIDAFRDKPSPRFAVANPAAKGVSRGQNMSSAAFEIYYSNTFSLEDRLQSEDRPDSPDRSGGLGVIDVIAPDTLDEHIVTVLRSKKDLADQVTGDPLEDWI